MTLKFKTPFLRLIILILFILSFVIIYSYIKFNKTTILPKTCLTETFNENFKNLDKIKVNSEYNFSAIFNCKDWDEIIIIGGPVFSRTMIYTTSGIILPKVDYLNYTEGTIFLFFIKKNRIISEPIPIWHPNFIFSQNFNRYNYLKVGREKSRFIYKPFEHSEFELFTLELIDNGG